MTIRDLAKFNESLPDWAMLDGCFGGRIRPTDIDGCVERNGQCLFLEHKGSGAFVSEAQNIAFAALAGQGNTVIVFWSGSADGHDTTHMMVHELGRELLKLPATLGDVRAEATRWYRQANGGAA